MLPEASCFQGFVFLPLFTSSVSDLDFISNSTWFLTWTLYAKIWPKRIEHQKSNLAVLVSLLRILFLFIVRRRQPRRSLHPLPGKAPHQTPFKCTMINGGAAYLDVPVTFLSMWVCMSGGAYIHECLWVSAFQLFMRLKCSSGMPCNALWK